jgi:8-oxo-dGTP pyrophosphatase MutT (NUDIX family)
VPQEISSGAIVLRRLSGRWWLAAIRPGGKPAGVWALPKGLVTPGEPPAETALREVEEETGVRGELVEKLGDVRYVYTRAGERVFKIVSFYLVRYRSGRIGDVSAEHAHEVAEARWLPLDDAPRLLTYRG